VIAQLRDKGTVSRGWIGIQIQPVTADIAESLGMQKAEGALVAEPQADSPASKAGIVSGDVITAVNGTTIRDARELSRTIGGMPPGSKVKLDVLQKGKERSVDLTLGELPNQREARAATDGDRGQQRSQRSMELGRLGMSVAPAGSVAGAGKDGVVVTEVQPSGAAAERGFKEGDVILEVGGKAVSSVGDVRDALQAARTENKNTVLIRVKTGGSSRFVAVPLGRG
jgi:serine protease Do